MPCVTLSWTRVQCLSELDWCGPANSRAVGRSLILLLTDCLTDVRCALTDPIGFVLTPQGRYLRHAMQAPPCSSVVLCGWCVPMQRLLRNGCCGRTGMQVVSDPICAVTAALMGHLSCLQVMTCVRSVAAHVSCCCAPPHPPSPPVCSSSMVFG